MKYEYIITMKWYNPLTWLMIFLWAFFMAVMCILLIIWGIFSFFLDAVSSLKGRK